jgi:DNA repair protein RecO (recombination protein O)
MAFFLRGRTGKRSMNSMLHRVSILDTIAYESGSHMPVIREMSPAADLGPVITDIYKNTVAIFICEVITKFIRESEPNPALYSFLSSNIQILAATDHPVYNFHLHFLAHLCRILGFFPSSNYSAENKYFDPQAARFTDIPSGFTENESLIFYRLMTTPLTESWKINGSGKERTSLAGKLTSYLSEHLGITIELKSIKILHEIFS